MLDFFKGILKHLFNGYNQLFIQRLHTRILIGRSVGDTRQRQASLIVYNK